MNKTDGRQCHGRNKKQKQWPYFSLSGDHSDANSGLHLTVPLQTYQFGNLRITESMVAIKGDGSEGVNKNHVLVAVRFNVWENSGSV